MELNIDLITFGKYKDKYLNDMLRDRKYCDWLLQQKWFQESYEYIYNRVKEYKPKSFFYKDPTSLDTFIDSYANFNLTPVDDLELPLTDKEKLCYSFYLKTINDLKTKIKVRITKEEENIYNITAPSKWLQQFETSTGLMRDDFKEFMSAYELPNITSVVEDIKKEGGVEYKGSNSFKIAKKRSTDQEKYWEDVLKLKYEDHIGVQFKYNNCFFDFINISTNTIYECKLGLKDFNEEQYQKYLTITGDKYNIIYLIANDCVIDTDMETIYTSNMEKYLIYQCEIPLLKNPTKFDEIIFDYDIYEIDDLNSVL